MTALFSEPSSIIRGRGRPSRFDPKWLRTIRSSWPEIRSDRGIVEKAYMLRAFALVYDVPGFEWLADRTTGQVRHGILSELGRIDDDGRLIEAALWACREKPSAEKMARTIRVFRRMLAEVA